LYSFFDFQVCACSASGFAVKPNRTCRRVTAGTGQHSVPAKRNHPGAIQTVVHVMPAAPSLRLRGVARYEAKQEAIQCTRMDCFTLRVRNDGSAGRLYETAFSLFALLKGCNSNCRARHPRKILCFQQCEQETGRFMQLTCLSVIANAVKQSSVRAWIASP
jgi:hypothetical protein